MEPVTDPIGVAVFGQDPGLPIRKFAERDYSTITHWSEFDRGGRFAAMEQPELYVGDLATFVGSLDGRVADSGRADAGRCPKTSSIAGVRFFENADFSPTS